MRAEEPLWQFVPSGGTNTQCPCNSSMQAVLGGKNLFEVCRGPLNFPEVKEEPRKEEQMFFKSHFQYFLLFKTKFLHSCYHSWMLPAQFSHGERAEHYCFFCLWHLNTNLPALVSFKIVVSGVLSFSTVYIEKLLIEILLRKCVGSHWNR